MKKINTALFCIFVLLFCSCDVLNKAPLDEIADDSFWSDETLVKYYVNDLYSEISVDGQQLQENRSDNSVSAQRDKWRASYFKFNYDMVSASDPQDDDVWEDYYVKVRKCNRFFERIGTSTIEESEKSRLTGEVHFLRAMFYFEMVKRYGGVILLDKVLTMEDNWEIPRSSEKECYDFILDDLKKATEMLPASYGSREKGHATKGAAYALKSRVELYDKRYEDVIKSCAEVYKLGYELVDGTTPEKYRSIWWTTNKDNKEIIFDIQYKSPDVYNNMMVCNMVTYINDKYGDRGWGGLGPTQELVDAFEMADGSPATQYSQAPADQVFDINTCGIYEGREPRFYANIVFHGSQIFFNADKGAVTVDRYLMDTPDKGDGSLTGYNVWKWIDYDNYNYPYAGASSPDFSTNWIILRYAEIYLNDAEARLETGDVEGARKAVNVIRQRVGLPALTESDPAKLRELIRKERRIEFAFEEQRFYDVRRWKVGPETQTTLHGVRFVSPTEFKITKTDIRTWNDRLYLTPIPHDEIVRSSVLTQNPGY
ncbi:MULTISPECIES: RagB/SusD family nutrient uptake outer membrane protein [Bacteroides]|uniref:RagB/SusD family nutrient uptake outer membrane protein n=1 Tax=Bacteroides TaxID=816 RepID=UPI002295474F|nr:RagB/SusD family nutrient uptake outer membrane protein [Bacteroides fragilis]MCY6345074.1 RagB/SusD family nutrient uptake outer membrane protein [Bacteroides fragilis]MCZ2672676.1 RagB/SusD family nutrient uptake outer membrane protein [Bacteroides fragilis]